MLSILINGTMNLRTFSAGWAAGFRFYVYRKPSTWALSIHVHFVQSVWEKYPTNSKSQGTSSQRPAIASQVAINDER